MAATTSPTRGIRSTATPATAARGPRPATRCRISGATGSWWRRVADRAAATRLRPLKRDRTTGPRSPVEPRRPRSGCDRCWTLRRPDPCPAGVARGRLRALLRIARAARLQRTRRVQVPRDRGAGLLQMLFHPGVAGARDELVVQLGERLFVALDHGIGPGGRELLALERKQALAFGVMLLPHGHQCRIRGCLHAAGTRARLRRCGCT